jgi:hypothetical protein
MKNLVALLGQDYSANVPEGTTSLRAMPISSIVLDSQRNTVEVRDGADDISRRYVIDTTRDARHTYGYVVTYKPKWESTEQRICSGELFQTADEAIRNALHKIEAWEQWLEASRPGPI